MSERTENRTIFTLLDVARSIQKTLNERYTTAFWVKAEMNKLNLHPPSGHCYPELVEKKDGKIIAEMRSVLWRDDYQRINLNFIRILKETLKNGITILFQAKISFDPVYGLSLRILDIDPAYSLGELEREKQETIDRLRSEGIYDRNRSLPMPLLPKRIAILSVETSKGYADFVKTIGNNPWGYTFFHLLFPAILQGDRAVDSMLRQLQQVRKVLHHFDAVAIIRGGGGEVGLTCYNDYRLCQAIALFPIPVITGIGHSTNETVAELIALRNAITPTELADYLLQQFHNFARPVEDAREIIISESRRLLRDEKQQLLQASKYFRSVTGNRLLHSRHAIVQLSQAVLRQSEQTIFKATMQTDQLRLRIGEKAALLIQREERELRHMEKTISLLDPASVLKRGYSITLREGKLVTDPESLQPGDRLSTILSAGTILSIVEQGRRSSTEQNPDNKE